MLLGIDKAHFKGRQRVMGTLVCEVSRTSSSLVAYHPSSGYNLMKASSKSWHMAGPTLGGPQKAGVDGLGVDWWG